MARSNLQTNPSSYRRTVTKAPETVLKNRFIEQNPILNDTEYSYISRPGLKKWIEVGEGHIRKIFSEPGVFNGDIFVVSATFLYRVNSQTGTPVLIGELSTQPLGSVSMAATAPVGDGPNAVPAYLYIAEGGVLWCYSENVGARGQLQYTGAVSNSETVEINGVYYQYTNGSVDAGTPDGSSGNPWLVDLGATTAEAVENLYKAINALGAAGTTYSTALTEHTTVRATAYTSADLFVQAKAIGTTGNTYTTTETMANGEWGGGTLSGGGSPGIYQITMPEDYGAISVAHINSYVIVVPIQSEDLATNGRFYWIEPGENTVDPLDFATAERSPDPLSQVVVFSDMFWLLGDKTVEPWLTTGDPAAPMQRYRPILFDRGAWEGTAIQVKDSLVVTDQDGAVFQIKGGLNRISTPQIEERIRKAIQLENKLTFS